ncbi:hypothetical protein BGZ98_005608, partial [Dissophora globulifera]
MSHPDHNGSADTHEHHHPRTLSASSSSYVSVDDVDISLASHASSTYSVSDVDSPIMTKASLPAPSVSTTKPTTSSSHSPSSNPKKSTPKGRTLSFTHKHEWPNGKRPRGYRTQEGKDAAEKSKNYKSGVSIPHLSASCNTYEGVLKHALLGAIRSGSIGYGLKAMVNLCLGMLKVMKGKVSFGRIFMDSFLGADAIRFGSFFGAFSFLWKFVNNGLRLYRGQDDRINGAVAGAIAGLAVLIESHERRVAFAQQMFIR